VAETAAEKPATLENLNATNNPSTNLPPLSESAQEPLMETNCVSPGSASLPDNVTLPPAHPATSGSHDLSTRPPAPGKTSHKSLPPHNPAGVYVVKSGDTLTHIASSHGTTVQALKIANHLKSDHIFTGEKLKLAPADLAAAKATQN
jgi:hypothetical protein